MAKGIEYPQRAERSFIGCYVEPTQKARLVAAADSCGMTVTQLLTTMVDRIEPLVDVMALRLHPGKCEVEGCACGHE